MHQEKKFDRVFKGNRNSIKKYKKVKFILAGRDDMNGKVQKIIYEKKKKNIKVVGFVNDISKLLLYLK